MREAGAGEAEDRHGARRDQAVTMDILAILCAGKARDQYGRRWDQGGDDGF